MDSTNLGNENKIVKHLSKNPLVPWQRLVDLNLDLMSTSEKSSPIQKTYQSTNSPYSFACKSNSNDVPSKDRVQNRHGIDSDYTKTTTVKDEIEYTDDFDEVKVYSEFKVASDIECTIPFKDGHFSNAGENCSDLLVQKTSIVGTSVNGANNLSFSDLLDVEQQQQHNWSSGEPDAIYSSSLLKVISNREKADLAIQTEINEDGIVKKFPVKTRSLNSISYLSSFRESNNEDSGIATHECTVDSSKSEIINAETDSDFESDWDDTEVRFAADDTEMYQSIDDNVRDECAPPILSRSRSTVVEIELEDSLIEIDYLSECHSLDVNKFKENHASIFDQNIIAENKTTQIVHYLDFDNVENLNVDNNINTYERINEVSPPNCSLSKSLHSMRYEQSQVQNERFSYCTQSCILKSASLDSLVSSGSFQEKMTTVNEFHSAEISQTPNVGNKNEESDTLGEIDLSWATKNRSQQKSIKGNDLNFSENVYVDRYQHENPAKRLINNGRDCVEHECYQKESQERLCSQELCSHKQSKKLTRDPFTSWKHLVDANLESLAVKNVRSISYSDIDQDRLSMSAKSQSNRKHGESLVNFESQNYGFKNIDSSIIYDYIPSGVFAECYQTKLNQSDGTLSYDCVIIDDLRFGETLDGLENSIDKTDVVLKETVGDDVDFVTFTGETSYRERNLNIAATTQYQSANDQITCHVEGMREVSKDKEISGKVVSETRLCGYRECSIEIVAHNSESHKRPDTPTKTSVEGYASSQSMQNNYSKSSNDEETMIQDSKSEHEYGNILLEATFDDPLLKVQLLPGTSRVTNEFSDKPHERNYTDMARKYERTHSQICEKRVSRSKTPTNRNCQRRPKGVSAKSVETHGKCPKHVMKEESPHHMGSVDFSRSLIETQSSQNLDLIGAGWGKLTGFINRLVNVFSPSEERNDHGEESDYPTYSNTNKDNLPHNIFQDDSHSLFENNYAYSTIEEQFHTEPFRHKRTKKQRRRKELNLPPSIENSIESNEHSFPYANECEQSTQYNQRDKVNIVQITDTCISDCIPTDYSFEITPRVHDSNAWGWVHAGETNPSASAALTRSSSRVAQKCIDDAGYVKVHVQSDIPNSGVSVDYTRLDKMDPASCTGSRVSFNMKSRKAKTAVILDTHHAANEEELCEFFTSSSANTSNRPMFTPGQKTHRNGTRRKKQVPVNPSPLIQDRLSPVNAVARSPMTSSTRLSLLEQTLPDTLRSVCGVDTANAGERGSTATEQSQPRRVEQVEDNVDEDVAEVMTDDMLTSSLECLLEMLLKRGKVSQAFVATVEGQVLAKTSGLRVTTHDVSALVCCLTSNYQGVARITLLTIAYQCFKLEQGSFLVGRADNSVFVACQGKQTIVVGFSHPSSPGSCIREIQELSLALGQRGL